MRAYVVSPIGPLVEVRIAHSVVGSSSTHLLDFSSRPFFSAVRINLFVASACLFSCGCATDDFQRLIPRQEHSVVNLVAN